MTIAISPDTGAEALLMGLKAGGVDHLFGNAGTDFAPIIEALVAKGGTGLMPEPWTIPHETVAVAMAHGYYLATGRPQAAMVHVNVGLANAAMGVINAAGDNIPLVMMSGRSPLTEHERTGARNGPIHYGQEMYDQAGIVRGATKFDYELRYPEQGGAVAARALALALSEPRGPVYVSMPRETLCEAIPQGLMVEMGPRAAATRSAPDPAAVEEAARMLAAAERPLVLCQRGDPEGRLGAALADLAGRCALPVVEAFPVRNVMASNDPMLLGYRFDLAIQEADVIVVLDAAVPWIESKHRPGPGKRIVHVGPDPLFQRTPMRAYQTDLAITSDPALFCAALADALEPRVADAAARRAAIAARTEGRLAKAQGDAAEGARAPMSAPWLARCLSDAMDEDAVVFNELGAPIAPMRLCGPNRYFNPPHSGGLGWGVPAALGAQLAHPERLTVACIGDGSYMFANPVACHQVAEALDLPILTVVKNNGMWNAVRRATLDTLPGGKAAKANRMPFVSLEPSPDYTRVAEASRAYAERVENGRDLPAALERAVHVIRTERRQALLELRVEVTRDGV